MPKSGRGSQRFDKEKGIGNMSRQELDATAMNNLAQLAKNTYPGRGLIIGQSPENRAIIQVYWIMGRSDNSRNRVFKHQGGRLYTEAANPAAMKDPSLIIYNAMDELPGQGEFVVSNGDQTDTVILALLDSPQTTLRDALINRVYEPDAPNFTPRLTGLCSISHNRCLTQISILWKPKQGDNTDRTHFIFRDIDLPLGLGLCVTTYTGDGDPLPSFLGPPYLMPIDDSIDEMAETYWDALNEANRVALAVKSIDIATGRSEITYINRVLPRW